MTQYQKMRRMDSGVLAKLNLFGELHGLQGQLSGGRHDDGPGPRFGLRGFQPLKHGHQEGSRLAAAGPRHGNNVFAVQDHRDGLKGARAKAVG